MWCGFNRIVPPGAHPFHGGVAARSFRRGPEAPPGRAIVVPPRPCSRVDDACRMEKRRGALGLATAVMTALGRLRAERKDRMLAGPVGLPG